MVVILPTLLVPIEEIILLALEQWDLLGMVPIVLAVILLAVVI